MTRGIAEPSDRCRLGKAGTRPRRDRLLKKSALCHRSPAITVALDSHRVCCSVLLALVMTLTTGHHQLWTPDIRPPILSLLRVYSLVSVGSPAGVPSVMAITNNGFCRAFCLAGPSKSGCRIFWSKAVPSGVRPKDVLRIYKYGLR